MAQQPQNKNQAKGFSGLDSMVSDVSRDVEHAERVGQSSQSRSAAAESQASGKAATAPTTAASIEKVTGATSGSSGIKWVLGTAAIIFVVWLIENSSKQETPTYSPPPVTVPAPAPPVIPSPVPALAPPPSAAPSRSGVIGEKPPVGDAHVLNREQIRYCLSEKIRLDAIETIINASRNLEVDKFNGLVADYNSRCGRFRYRPGSLESVSAEVEARRAEIERNARTAWVRDLAGLSTSPKNDRGVPKDKRAEQKRPISKNRQPLDSSASVGPGVLQAPGRLPSLSEENPLSKLDLSGLSEGERSAIERKCKYDRQYRSPVEYYSCVGNEVRKLGR